eukprot:UN02434
MLVYSMLYAYTLKNRKTKLVQMNLPRLFTCNSYQARRSRKRTMSRLQLQRLIQIMMRTTSCLFQMVVFQAMMSSYSMQTKKIHWKDSKIAATLFHTAIPMANDGYMLGREQLVANIIPRVMRFCVNVIVGPDKSNNTSLMMATSHYLVDRYCFTKGAHYVNILPQRDDPYSYCLDLILARALKIDIPDAGNIEKDVKANLDVSFQVLKWLRDQESNDDVGLNNCLLLC